jgi:hypothetical protein
MCNLYNVFKEYFRGYFIHIQAQNYFNTITPGVLPFRKSAGILPV